MTGFSWLPSRLLIVSRAKPSGGLLPCRWLAAKAAESARRHKKISNTSADPDVTGHALPPHSTTRWNGCYALRQDVLACAAKLLCCFVSNQVQWDGEHTQSILNYMCGAYTCVLLVQFPGPVKQMFTATGAMFWQWPSWLITLSLLVNWFALSACFCCCLSRFKLYFYMFVCLSMCVCHLASSCSCVVHSSSHE